MSWISLVKCISPLALLDGSENIDKGVQPITAEYCAVNQNCNVHGYEHQVIGGAKLKLLTLSKLKKLTQS